MSIKSLQIRHYKSIKAFSLSPKRINVFIGEPNSGKSNILEAISFFSAGAVVPNHFQKLFRFKSPRDLFYDFDLSKKIEVITDLLSCEIYYAKNDFGAVMNQFYLDVFSTINGKKKGTAPIKRARCILRPDGIVVSNQDFQFETKFRVYHFERPDSFQLVSYPFLNPPYGDNLPGLIIGFPKIKEIVSKILRDKGFRLQINPVINNVEITKEVNDEIYAYPYVSLSETLQRIIFITLAVESNKDSILIFDEPESNTYPFYTKYIAERIALDNNNQYFLTTHNPYLLFSLIEKTPASELNVIVTFMRDFETRSITLSRKQIEKAVDFGHDLYFNLDKLIAK